MALKVAPEQGWGIYWNEFHPDRPFTPVEVNMATHQPSVAASAQAGGAPAPVTAQGSASHSVFAAPAAADGFAAVNFAPMNAVASVTAAGFGSASQALSQTGSGDHAPDAQGSTLSLNQLSFYGDDWLIVPSFANEAGTSYAGFDEGTWDLAGWSLSSDWYLV
jgi:hypothetical protein